MNANNTTGNFSFTWNSTKWDITNGSVPDNNYTGPWNDNGTVSGTLPENIAVNKSSAQAPGFDIYSMSRSTYLKTYLRNASSSNKIDLTALH